MIEPLLFHRFQGIWLGTLVAESLAEIDLASDRVAGLRRHIAQELADRGHGFWDGAIADWDLSYPLDWIRATLPLAFFFHDEPEYWVDRLAILLNFDPEVHQVLQRLATLVANTLTNSPCPAPKLDFPESTMQWSDVSLSDPIQAIALAQFYSEDTPYHFRLAVLRSIRGTQIPVVASLTGALMGGHLGVGGIPWEWQCRPTIADLWQDSHHLLESLWMQWLGCPHRKFDLSIVGAIATVTTLQPRPRLALVSQTSRLHNYSSHPHPIP